MNTHDTSPNRDAAARPSDRLKPTRPPISADGSEVSPTVSLPRSENPRPARARSVRTRLGPRDLTILHDLAAFRLMTGRQLQRLHVTNSNPVTAARRSRAVLRRLTELALLVRLDRRIGGIQAGSDGHVYGLSGLGYAVLALDDEAHQRGRTIWETKPAFQDHLLAIAELYVGLREAERSGTAELLDFETEPTAWRWFAGPLGERLPVKPDAFMALGLGDLELRLFIEVDCGTESLPTIQRKCRRYLDYWHSGLEQQRHGVFPRVWWLTESLRREARIANLIASFTAEEQALFAVAPAATAPDVFLSLPTTGGQP